MIVTKSHLFLHVHEVDLSQGYFPQIASRSGNQPSPKILILSNKFSKKVKALRYFTNLDNIRFVSVWAVRPKVSTSFP